MNAETVWNSCIEDLGKQVSSQLFSTWFRPITFIAGNETSIELEVPNRFFLDWIQEHYLPLITGALQNTAKRSYSLNWRVSGGRSPVTMKPELPVKKVHRRKSLLSKMGLIQNIPLKISLSAREMSLPMPPVLPLQIIYPVNTTLSSSTGV